MEQEQRFLEHGVRVVVVSSLESSDAVKSWNESAGVRPLHAYCPPEEGKPLSALYEGYGLGRTIMLDVEEGAENDNLLRTKGMMVAPLGGDVMLDKDGKVVYEYYSKSLPDRPDVEDVISAAREKFEEGRRGSANPAPVETTEWSAERPQVGPRA